MRYIGLYANVCRFRDSKETEKQKKKKKERLADMRMRDARGGERDFNAPLPTGQARFYRMRSHALNVFSCYRMCSLAIECVLELYNVFSYLWELGEQATI